jgi:hypothetical protein
VKINKHFFAEAIGKRGGGDVGSSGRRKKMYLNPDNYTGKRSKKLY